MSRKYNRYDDVDDGLLIEICQRFLRGETRVKTAKWKYFFRNLFKFWKL